MPRPPKPRRIGHRPDVVYFKPRGVRLRQLQEVVLAPDEVEALRLADLQGLSHEEVGSRMEVSRATAGRILANARHKVAEALVEGLAIRIEFLPSPKDPASERPQCEDAPEFDQMGPCDNETMAEIRLGRGTRAGTDGKSNLRPGRGSGRGRGCGRARSEDRDTRGGSGQGRGAPSRQPQGDN